MKNIKKILLVAFTLFMVLQFNSFVAPTQSTAQAATKTAVCKTGTGIYKKANTESKRLASVKAKKKVKITGQYGRYYKVTATINGKKVSGYSLKTKYKVNPSGKDVINYAKQFLGNPYSYGGTSLTHGTDCSGFTMGVYKHFGINLPHSSYSQRSYGKSVSSLSSAKAGDLLCFNGHVGLYMGDGKMIHAANPSSGICTTSYIRNVVSIRRFF